MCIRDRYEYEVRLFDSNGADSVTRQTVEFFAAPTVTIRTEFEAGNVEATLTADVVDEDNPMGPFTFVWTRDGAVLAGETTNTITASIDGTYVVTVQDPDLQTGTATETIDFNGPVTLTATHRGSRVINEGSQLVVETSDTDGADQLGAWSITRQRGSNAVENLFNGTGQLDGATVGQGLFNVTNGADEDEDDVYTVTAQDTATPDPHIVTAEVTVDVVNMVTLNITYMRGGGLASNGTLDQTTATLIGIPGTAIPAQTINTAANAGHRLVGSPTCTISPTVAGPTCNTRNNTSVTFGGVFPNTGGDFVVTINQATQVDPPNIDVSISGGTASVSAEDGSSVTGSGVFSSNCPNATSNRTVSQRIPGTFNFSRGNVDCATGSCTGSYTVSATGYDQGSAGYTQEASGSCTCRNASVGYSGPGSVATNSTYGCGGNGGSGQTNRVSCTCAEDGQDLTPTGSGQWRLRIRPAVNRNAPSCTGSGDVTVLRAIGTLAGNGLDEWLVDYTVANGGSGSISCSAN